MAMKANSMSIYMPHKQPLFSIEQTELIRRLRNSGITREQIIIAFDSLQNIDNDIGSMYNIPITQTPYAKGSSHQTSYKNIASKFADTKHAISATDMDVDICSTQNGVNTSSSAINNDSESNGQLPLSPVINNTSSTSMVQSTMAPVPTTMDLPNDSEELQEFLKLGPVGCCDEIRNFVVRHSIKQQQIATLSGISQSYVSRYLKGDFYDVSERSRLAMHKWYVAYRSDPGSIGTVYGASLMAGVASPKISYSLLGRTPSDLSQFATEFMNSPRRERFVFRPRHLEILERSFHDDSYPSHDRRDEIATSCNQVTEDIVNRPLTEKERVSAQIVSNWFANKRKDMRKLAREEGLISQVPFRARGRPCRPIQSNSLTSLGASPGRSEGGGTGQYTPKLNSCASLEMGSDGSDDSPDTPVNGVQAIENAVLAAADISGTIPMDEVLSTINQSSATNGDSESSQNALSMSVEMAAVNQAIIALTGQNPIQIKTE